MLQMQPKKKKKKKKKRQEITNASKDAERGNPCTLQMRMQIGAATAETVPSKYEKQNYHTIKGIFP